jgi:CRP-like cAMP-binding protein
MDILIGALDEPDGFLRFKIIAAIEKLRHTRPELSFRRGAVDSVALKESARLAHYLALRRDLGATLHGDGLLARALADKLSRALDRSYRLLGVLYPWKDIAAARWEIEHDDTRSRAAALEYLDNLLKGELRKRLVPLLEEARPAGQEPGSDSGARESPQSLRAALVRAIRDEDPEISAAAIHHVWQRRLADLSSELERVPPPRDGRNRHAFEAASWVRAEFRTSQADRRAVWLEPLPTVALADRLRGLPLFSSVTVDELFRIADAGRQVCYEPGRVLYQEGVTPDNLLFLLNGSVSLKTAAGEIREVLPPSVLGFQELLEGRPMLETLCTTEPTVCLAVSGEEFRSLLADNTELVQGLFRTLWRPWQAGGGRAVFSGRHPEKGMTAINGSLKPIQKVFVLESIPVFSDVSAEEMLRLASIVTEVNLEEGSILFSRAGSPAMYAVLSGELTLESFPDKSALTAGPYDVVGIYETFAGIPPAYHASVSRPGTALRIERDDLFDLLSQRSALLQQLFSALLRSYQSRLL